MDCEITTTTGEEDAETKQRECHAAKTVEIMRIIFKTVETAWRVEEEDGEGMVGMR